MLNLNQNKRGTMLVISLVATGLFLVLLLGSISLVLMQQKLYVKKITYAQALHVAEAGANYYRWVLYHDNDDYCNEGMGETCIGAPDYGPYGPYAYSDDSNTITGYYELYITPPPIDGSTIVEIKSVGWVDGYENYERTINVQCGIASWSSYSTLANDTMRFGSGTEIWGRMHSNGGIRFDGIAAHDVITSALLEYDDPDHSETGPDVLEFGVHTHLYAGASSYDSDEVSDGSNPPNPPNYPALFMAGRSFPVPIVSFDLLDNYVNEALVLAEADGMVLEASGDDGYHLTLNPDDTLDIYIVNSTTPNCNPPGPGNYETHGISAETAYDIGTSTPPNGIIFIKDKVWVDGQIDGNRLNILAFDEPLGGSVSDIIINNDLTYTNYDGTDAIGLIAQKNISIGLFSEDDLRIDAALIAKEGRIGRENYPDSDNNNCNATYDVRSIITIYGSLATRQRYGFAWTSGSGYTTRNLIYDSNLTYSPPPHYPTTGEYTFISWEEE